MEKTSLLLIIILVPSILTREVHIDGYINLGDRPPSTVYSEVGSNVTMKWKFKVHKERPFKNDKKPMEFLFGEWKYPGYLSLKIMLVQGPLVKLKSAYYDDKIKWRGNMSTDLPECYGEVTLLNLTEKNFKMYGINIFAHPKLTPRQHMLKIVHRKRAKITKLVRIVEAYEGNRTHIVCEAEGLPTPSVQIHKHSNPTIRVNGTGRAILLIEHVQPHHKGQYMCTVHSDGELSNITETMQLKVIERTGSVITNATVPTATETPTSSVVSPSNRETAKDSSSSWMILSIVALVIIGILVFLIVVMGCCWYKYHLRGNQKNENGVGLLEPNGLVQRETEV